MLRINLLPVKKIKQQAEAWWQLKTFGMFFAVLLAVLTFIAFGMISKANGLNAEIVKLQAEKARLDNILKLIEDLEKKKKAVDAQAAAIEKVEKTSALTARLLDEVANRTPNERLWLSALTQSGTNLTLRGIALDSQTVADYIERLKKIPSNIIEVTLQNVSLVSQSGRSLKSFSLSCTVNAEQKKSEEAASGQDQSAAAQKK